MPVGSDGAPASPPAAATAKANAETALRSKRYLGLLAIAGVLGVPISALAYGFLQLTNSLQTWLYTDLPHGFGFATQPLWWPIVPLSIAGLVVGPIVRYLPGAGGELPVDGFHAGSPPPAINLVGIAAAAITSIGLGAVVGPEGPLIALGGGLAVLAIRLSKRRPPHDLAMIMSATGSFAAISTLLGSPIVGAFLLLEVTGLAGALESLVLVPGLFSAGIGALIFTGLGSWTGHGTFSLTIPHLPEVTDPTASEFGYALLIGLGAPLLCWLIRGIARTIHLVVARWILVSTVVIALAVAGLAIAYTAATGHSNKDVLFSGENELPGLIGHASTYSAGALVLIVVFKALAYSMSLVGFRGGPTFPAMFIGAAAGIALSHLGGLSMIAGIAMGVGAMTVGMLRLPITAVLLTSLFLGSDGVTVMPLTIVAVVISHVVTIRLTPKPPDEAPESAPEASNAPR